MLETFANRMTQHSPLPRRVSGLAEMAGCVFFCAGEKLPCSFLVFKGKKECMDSAISRSPLLKPKPCSGLSHWCQLCKWCASCLHLGECFLVSSVVATCSPSAHPRKGEDAGRRAGSYLRFAADEVHAILCFSVVEPLGLPETGRA